MKETDKAYLAGIIDGEGSLHISKVKSKKANRGFVFVAVMSVWNTKQKLIDHIQKLIGEGSVFFKEETRKEWNDKYLWQANPNLMRKILPQLVPYLIIKKELAKTILRFLELYNHHNRGELNPKVFELYKQVKEFNRKGKHPKLEKKQDGS